MLSINLSIPTLLNLHLLQTSLLLPKSRHSKRTPNASFNSSLIHKTLENSLINEPFIKFVMESTEELLKN